MSEINKMEEIDEVDEIPAKKASLPSRTRVKGNYTNYEKVPKKPDGVRRDILGVPLNTFAHVDSGEFCLGQHMYGQCIYCKNCHDYIRPANIRKACLGWQEEKVRTESSCQKCAEKKFNKEIADIKLWSVPGLAVDETDYSDTPSDFSTDKMIVKSVERFSFQEITQEEVGSTLKSWIYNHKTKTLIDIEEDVSS